MSELDGRRRYWICPGHITSSYLWNSCQLFFFQNVTFEEFYVNNVDKPIYLNQVRRLENTPAHSTDACSQCYQTAANVCAEYPSTVTISDVHCTYLHLHSASCSSTFPLDINVTGMSSGHDGNVVVDLECSAECYGITATGTSLTSPNGTAVYYCQNVANETALDFACTAPPPSS